MGKLRSKRPRQKTRQRYRHKTRRHRRKTLSIQNKRKQKRKKVGSDKEKGAGFINMNKLGSLFFKYGMNKNNPVYPYFAEAEEQKKDSLGEDKQKVSHELQQYEQQTRKRKQQQIDKHNARLIDIENKRQQRQHKRKRNELLDKYKRRSSATRKLDTLITSRGSKLSRAIKQYQKEEDEEDRKDNKATQRQAKYREQQTQRKKQKIEQQQQAINQNKINAVLRRAKRRRNTRVSCDKSSPLGYGDL